MKQTFLSVVAVVLLVVFAGIGIAHVFKPDWFIKRSNVRGGGEILSEYHRAGFQIAGVIFAAIAIYVLYDIFVR